MSRWSTRLLRGFCLQEEGSNLRIACKTGSRQALNQRRAVQERFISNLSSISHGSFALSDEAFGFWIPAVKQSEQSTASVEGFVLRDAAGRPLPDLATASYFFDSVVLSDALEVINARRHGGLLLRPACGGIDG